MLCNELFTHIHVNWFSKKKLTETSHFICFYFLQREIEDTILLAIQSPEVYDDIARGTRCKFETNRPRAVLFEGPPGLPHLITCSCKITNISAYNYITGLCKARDFWSLKSFMRICFGMTTIRPGYEYCWFWIINYGFGLIWK